jgi:protein SCO1/2
MNAHPCPAQPRTAAIVLFLCGVLVALGPIPARAHTTLPAIFNDVGFDQRLDEQVPLDATFRDETGRAVTLGEYFGRRPVILVPVYYSCTTLCPILLDGLARSLRPVSFDMGKDFDIVTVTINPRETPAQAAAKKEQASRRYGRPGAANGWHFLTGEEASIRRLMKAIGFRYTYDAKTDQYAHAAGVVILTPQGRTAHYFYGIDLSPRDLRLGLIEAADNKIGSPIDQVLLFCYHYDPLTGRYGLIIMNVIRLAGLATVLVLGAFIVVMVRRDRLAAAKVGGAH